MKNKINNIKATQVKKEIVISLGDEGAIITVFEGGLNKNRYFFETPYVADFENLMISLRDHCVYIVLDNIDQNYVFNKFPLISSAKLQKIIDRKISSEFDEADLNTFQILHKNKKSREVNVAMISLRNSSPLIDWLEIIYELPNLFKGIYLLPIESVDYVNEIRQIYNKDKNFEKFEWEILISHNKVGGYRQVVFRNGKIVFTRISQNVGIQSPDMIGDNISKEMESTLEYIRRIGYEEKSICVYVIASSDSFAYIDLPTIKSSDLLYLSPFEVDQKLGLNTLVSENDKFGDVVFAANFINKKKKQLRILPAKQAKILNYIYAKNTVKYSLYFLMGALPLATLMLLYSVITTNIKLSDLDKSINVFQIKNADIEDFQQMFNIDPNFVNGFVDYYKQQENSNDWAFNILTTFPKISERLKSINNYTIQYKEKRQIVNIEAIFDFSGITNYGDYIFAIKELITKLEEGYKEHQVTIQGLPDFDNKSEIKISDQVIESQIKTDVTIRVK